MAEVKGKVVSSKSGHISFHDNRIFENKAKTEVRHFKSDFLSETL